MLALFFAGRMLRAGPEGRTLGLVFAYAWAAFPYTLFALNSNANDSLIALLVTVAFLALAHPPCARRRACARGVGQVRAARARTAVGQLPDAAACATRSPFSLAFGAVLVLVFALVVPDGGVRELYDRTIGFQLGRDSPFSIWGQDDGLGWLQDLVKAGTVLLAAGVALVPRRKTAVQVAALGAAVLIAVQIGLSHWFYLYIVWWLPFALIAFLSTDRPSHTQPVSRLTG